MRVRSPGLESLVFISAVLQTNIKGVFSSSSKPPGEDQTLRLRVQVSDSVSE